MDKILKGILPILCVLGAVIVATVPTVGVDSYWVSFFLIIAAVVTRLSN